MLDSHVVSLLADTRHRAIDVENFSYSGLKSFVEKIEFVLNPTPYDHQPIERTKFTWFLEG